MAINSKCTQHALTQKLVSGHLYIYMSNNAAVTWFYTLHVRQSLPHRQKLKSLRALDHHFSMCRLPSLMSNGFNQHGFK